MNDELDPRACDETSRESELPRRRVLGMAVIGAATIFVGCGGAESDGPRGAGTSGPGSSSGTGAGGGPGSGGAGGAGETGGAETGGAGGAPSCDAFTPSCVDTEDDPLGPYYRSGAPPRTVLDNPTGLGDRLSIQGRVMAADCVTPLAGATVEVWQANSAGDYDNETGDPGPTVWYLRGTIAVDACGNYAFETVVPGHYLNGPQYRPAHIHFRVSHAAAVTLVTQLYFHGDPYNTIDSMYKPSLEIALTDDTDATGPIKRGVFDIVLAPG